MSLAEAKAVDSESVKQCYSSGKELACRCPGHMCLPAWPCGRHSPRHSSSGKWRVQRWLGNVIYVHIERLNMNGFRFLCVVFRPRKWFLNHRELHPKATCHPCMFWESAAQRRACKLLFVWLPYSKEMEMASHSAHYVTCSPTRRTRQQHTHTLHSTETPPKPAPRNCRQS